MKLIIYADGGSRGNPGIAGSGTVVYADDAETVLREIVYVVGTNSTNNVAEYHGLLRGLEAAIDMEADEVQIYMDSRLVVEQMNGRWKIKHPDMKSLADQASRLMDQIDIVTLDWVGRNDNKVADALSNVAMDAAADGHEPGIVARDQPVNREPDRGYGHSGEVTAEDTNLHAAMGSNGEWTGSTTSPTTLLLLRHGQTEYSAQRRYCGHADVELTDLGHRQVRAAAEQLSRRGDIDLIVSSPLMRCQQTAEAVASVTGATIQIADELIEVNFGDWEGKTFDEAQSTDEGHHKAWITDTALAPPGGESLDALDARITQFRRKLVKEYPGRTIAVISHVNPIKSLIKQALGTGPHVFSHVFLDLASMSVVKFYSDDCTVPSVVSSVNETAYLR